MAKIRTFIAIGIPPFLQKELIHFQEMFRENGMDVRWVRPVQMHITLRFMGDVDEAKLPLTQESVSEAAQGVVPFEISLEGLGTFPARGLPRVLWVGINQGKNGLRELHQRLEDALVLRGFPRGEEQEFKAHVTLGRFRSAAGREGWEPLLCQMSGVTAGSFTAREIWVMRSDLSPHGPQYTQMANTPLR